MSTYYAVYNSTYLEHHGIKGQRWGVRRYQNADGTLTEAGKKRQTKVISKVNSMYDHSNKWTSRKIEKLSAKGKTAKANVMKQLVKNNEKSRSNQIDKVKKMNASELSKSKATSISDLLFGGANAMKGTGNSAQLLTTSLSRINEYNMQRAIRWTSNFTLNKTLNRMSSSEGLTYLRNKASNNQNTTVYVRS